MTVDAPGQDRVREAFRRQAEACRTLGSPFTARLCDLAAARLDDRGAVGRRILGWKGDPVDDALALRFAGALHRLVLGGSDAALAAVYPPHVGSDDARLWAAVEGAAANHARTILGGLDGPPQTNEVRRSAVLLPGFASIAASTSLPLALMEIGASAGLNLNWDSYRYRLGGVEWGDPSSPVLLEPEWTGSTVEMPVDLRVADRAGCDLNPLDPSAPDDRMQLLSYIWADQRDRFDRTEAAIGLAGSRRVRVERADAADWLERRLASLEEGRAHVVYHTIAWQYFPDAVRRRAEAAIAAAGERAGGDAPLAWLKLEPDGDRPGAALTLTSWPGGETRLLARADFHGRWIDWRG